MHPTLVAHSPLHRNINLAHYSIDKASVSKVSASCKYLNYTYFVLQKFDQKYTAVIVLCY